MTRLIAGALRWLLQKLGWLAVILAVLLATSWVAGEWHERERLRAELETQAAAVEARRREIEAGLGELDRRIERTERAWQDALGRYADVESQARDARRQADAARQEYLALQRAAAWWDWLVAPQRRIELEQARVRALALERAARAWEETRDRIGPRFRESPAATLHAERDAWQGELAALEELLRTQRERLERDPRERLVSAVRAQLPAALGILLAVMLAPLIVKGLLYFVIAPLAERLPPIRILPGAMADAIDPAPSAVSLPVELHPGEELALQSEYVQSSSRPARKRTRWFLNPALPFSSIASGMFALTAIRPEGDAPTRVMVSSQRDPLAEVALLELPAGAALVLQPRSLAGVVSAVDAPPRITRHWRLASLHAWLTLQFRYLVFHGPCRLVLKGCRGVRAERPEPGQARLVNQAATLGFGAGLDYRVTRCETFVSYYLGREDLFNDLFAGGPGLYVCEELPDAARRAGLGGRGLEGAVDAALKAFGI